MPEERDAGAVVRVGLVGYGYWGSKHARVLAGLPDVELTIIEGEESRRKSAQDSFPLVNVTSSLEDAAADLDAAVIATPPRTHGELGLQALRAGLHALVEKPMATSSDDCRRMIDADQSSFLPYSPVLHPSRSEYTPMPGRLRL